LVASFTSLRVRGSAAVSFAGPTGARDTAAVAFAGSTGARGAAAVVSVVFSGVAVAGILSKETVRFLRGVPCGEADDDEEDDDEEDDDEEDDDGVAASLVSADSFLSPATAVKLAMSKNNKPESLSRLVPFSSVASVAPWRAMRKAEGVSGSYLSCCL
jgi:hypothetical protein